MVDPRADASEITFMKRLMIALGSIDGLRIWRQNTGHVPVRDPSGRTVRIFSAGPPPGAADLTGIYRGIRVEIETKAAGGKLRPEQELWRDMIRTHGGVYVAVWGPYVDAAVDAVLKELVWRLERI
jgi:hypothetical protein